MVRWVAGLLAWTCVCLGAPAGAAAQRSCLGMAATIVSDEKQVSGTPGDDVIIALHGVRTVTGGAGDDRICTRWSRTDADGEGGNDRMAGSPGYHNFTGVVAGGRGDDVLSGDHQFLRGGLGDDTLTGEDLAGNAGNDLLDAGDPEPITVRFRTSSRRIVADLSDGTVRGEGRDRIEGDVYRLYASPYDDVLVAAPHGSGLVGGRGSDDLRGGPGDDYLYGDFEHVGPGTGGGPAARGEDVIRGGSGEDSMNGGAGPDLLRGGRGQDRVDGAGGTDRAFGGGGDDFLTGGQGDDHLSGGTGRDWVTYGFTFNDTEIDLDAGVALGVGTDLLQGIENAMGSSGKNTIRGDEGPNTLYGGTREDHIQGRGGDDYLWGIAWRDVLDGGEGFDVCKTGVTEPDVTIFCEKTPE